MYSIQVFSTYYEPMQMNSICKIIMDIQTPHIMNSMQNTSYVFCLI